jgi:hypothetical protein
MLMALLQLGIADVYHMVELWEENPKDDDLWIEAYQTKFEGKGKKMGPQRMGRFTGPLHGEFSPQLLCTHHHVS